MNRFASKAGRLVWLLVPAWLAGCSGDDTAPATGRAVGGAISGLSEAGLVLANGADTVSPPSGAASFTFPVMLDAGGAYAVSVKTQPAGETCSVADASGMVVGADVANVQLSCAPNGFTVGGAIAGLTSAGLVLADGTDSLSVAANATGFTLPTPVSQGAAFAVSVKTQPSGEQCSLAQSTGSIRPAGHVAHAELLMMQAELDRRSGDTKEAQREQAAGQAAWALAMHAEYKPPFVGLH